MRERLREPRRVVYVETEEVSLKQPVSIFRSIEFFPSFTLCPFLCLPLTDIEATPLRKPLFINLLTV